MTTLGRTPAQLFALWVGAWLALNGVAALASNPDLTAGSGTSELIGGATIANNGWHGLFHLTTGAAGLAVARRPAVALTYAWAIGAGYLAVAAWGLLDGADFAWIVPVDVAGSVLHAVEGLLAVAVALATTLTARTPRVGPAGGA